MDGKTNVIPIRRPKRTLKEIIALALEDSPDATSGIVVVFNDEDGDRAIRAWTSGTDTEITYAAAFLNKLALER